MDNPYCLVGSAHSCHCALRRAARHPSGDHACYAVVQHLVGKDLGSLLYASRVRWAGVDACGADEWVMQ
eukprot:12261888-Prorocentrum_lima.AAC.1